jgi:hypothetical protein
MCRLSGIASDGSKLITLSHISTFIQDTGKEEASEQLSTESTSPSCSIPRNVPTLPASYHKRDGPSKALLDALLPGEGSKSSSTNVTLQGMVCFVALS